MSTKCEPDIEFSDFNVTYTYTPDCTVRPNSLEELQTVVSEAGAARREIRATGTGYSLTECARGAQVRVCTSNLNNMIIFRSSTIDGAVPVSQAALDRGSGYVLTESGCSLRQLAINCIQFEASLPSFGATFYQTIAGAISTGTHGSHLNRAPLS
ncbi:MAG: FAD-binding protein, partial [Proteobacteria bacterium]|nr:FAD-binding protein [Pseudomonadota bacterium]